MRILAGLVFGAWAMGCQVSADPINPPPLGTSADGSDDTTPAKKTTTTTPSTSASASASATPSSSPATKPSSSPAPSCDLSALKGTWALGTPMWQSGAEKCVQTTGNAPFLPSTTTIKAVDDGSYVMLYDNGAALTLDVDKGDCMLVGTVNTTDASSGATWSAQIFISPAGGKADFSEIATVTPANGTACEVNSDTSAAKQ